MLILFFVNFDFAVLEHYHSTCIPSVFADKHVVYMWGKKVLSAAVWFLE